MTFKTFAAALVLAVTLVTFAGPAFARCDHSWQTASDGSACGDRAAAGMPYHRRAGGR